MKLEIVAEMNETSRNYTVYNTVYIVMKARKTAVKLSALNTDANFMVAVRWRPL